MLPGGVEGHALPIRGLSDDLVAPFSLRSAAEGVLEHLDELGLRRVHVCGLSLGAMIALQLVVDAPERVLTLTLSGAQVRPPRMTMWLQQMIFRMLPSRAIAPDPAVKRRLLGVMRAAARADFRDELHSIAVPTAALCGVSDHLNTAAARALARGVPGAALHLLDGGHLLHYDNPRGFARALRQNLAHRPEALNA